MLRYTLRVGLQYAFTLFVAICLNFALPRLAPGNPIDFLLPPELAGALPPEQIQQVAAQFGLDKPVPEQFVAYLAGLARGDLLYSVRYGKPVALLLAERLPWTLLLVGTAILLTSILGTAIGFWSAWRRGTAKDALALGGMMFLDSMPAFFVGMLLILLFSVKLGWLPIYGALPDEDRVGLAQLIEMAKRMVMPLLTLVIGSLAPVYLVARTALVSELREDYVLLAEAKGIGRAGVRRHAQRNALLPLSTLILLNIASMVGGASVVETVFSYPGLGRLIYESVIARDYPTLQGAFLLLAVGVMFASILAELVYSVIDPRIRRTGVVE